MMAEIGDNRHPLDDCSDLFDEAKNFMDGTEIVGKKQHDVCVEIIRQLRSARTAADEARQVEVAPLNEAKQAIQDRYNVWIKDKTGKIALAIDMIQNALAPYLLEQTRLKRENDARLSSEAAQAKADADAAIRASGGDLEAREEAEIRLADAKEAAAIAARAAKKTVAKGAQSRWDVELVDSLAAIRWAWDVNSESFDAMLIQSAKDAVKLGKREIPGFIITERIVV